jgi:mannose-6-phosphate isomerase class I
VFFFYPADRVALRNPRNEPYREVIVEILQHDTTPLQYDPHTGSYFYPNSDSLGTGPDPHVSYITSLTNTSVDIMNVQLVAGDSKPQPADEGALIVAITDADLAIARKTGGQRQLPLAQGEVKWLADSMGTFKNDGRQTARFAIFGMK